MKYIQTACQPGWRIPGAAFLSATLTGCGTGIEGRWTVTHIADRAVPSRSSFNIESRLSKARGVAPPRLPPFSGTLSQWTDKAVLDITGEGRAKLAFESGYAYTPETPGYNAEICSYAYTGTVFQKGRGPGAGDLRRSFRIRLRSLAWECRSTGGGPGGENVSIGEENAGPVLDCRLHLEEGVLDCAGRNDSYWAFERGDEP